MECIYTDKQQVIGVKSSTCVYFFVPCSRMFYIQKVVIGHAITWYY